MTSRSRDLGITNLHTQTDRQTNTHIQNTAINVIDVYTMHFVTVCVAFFRMKQVTRSMISAWKRGIAKNCELFIRTAKKNLEEQYQRVNREYTGKFMLE